MHTMQRAAPGVILVASLLTACGGGGSGSSDTSAVSSDSSQAALSSAPSTASTSNLSNPTPTASTASASTTSSSTSTATGSFRITWIPPVARYDGSPLSLSDINGFRIYYGKAPGSYPSQVNVANGTSQSAKVTNVPAGTYYVVMTTYDVNGLESGYSTVITKTAL